MKQIKLMSLTLLLLVSSILTAQNARTIAQKVKDRPNGDTRYSEMTMTLINKRGKKRVRKLHSYSIDIKEDTKGLIFFEYPGDVKGTGFLTWDYDDISKNDDKWLYLPAMKKTRRISGSSAKKDYFMGSDFTYDDMGKRSLDEDTHKLLGEEKLQGHLCWKLEYTTKDKRDAYSKKIAWIRQDCLIAIRVDYYDKLDHLQRQLLCSEIHKIGEFWIALQLKMTNVQTKHVTLLNFSNPQFDIPIDVTKFTVNNLEKGHI